MITIRPAVVADIDAMAHVHSQCWRETYAGMVPEEVLAKQTPEWMKERMWKRAFGGGVTGRADEERHFVAQEVRAGIIGLAGCGPSRHPQLKYAGELYAIYVLREFQGCGAGTGLLAAAAGFLLRRGFSSMVTWVLEDNLPARRFYESRGGGMLDPRGEVVFGSKTLVEAAYAWPDLKVPFSSVPTGPVIPAP